MSSIFLKDVLTACLPAFSVLDRAESVYTVQKLVFHRASIAIVTQAIFMIGLAKASYHNYYDCRGNFHGECEKNMLGLPFYSICYLFHWYRNGLKIVQLAQNIV